MKTDVKNTTEIYEYPRLDLEEGQRVSDKDIKRIVEEHRATFVIKFNDNDNFYNGKNQIFFEYKHIDAPNNIVNVPYARLLTSTVKGYMYKPGLIRYSSKEEENLNKIQEIYALNKEPLENAELGEHQARYGIAFELLYLSMKDNKTLPRMAVVKPQEMIPIFDDTLEKNLVAAIRYYLIDKSQLLANEKEKFRVELYLSTEIITFELIKEEVTVPGTFQKEIKTTLKELGVEVNIFNEVPLIIYKNNDEYLADYEPVRGLIVEYDKLFSDSANELDRFAAAYMVLQNYVLAGNDEEKRSKLDDLKRNRIFEIDENGSVTFLTKDIPVEFFKTIRDSIIDEIHKQTTIPNFQDETFGTSSGIAIQYKLTNFENTAADKESFFRVGLERRLDFMKRYLKIKEQSQEDFIITIKFNRNLPTDIIEKVNVISALKASGLMISDKTLLSLLPFIENVDDEIEEAEKQKEKETESLDIDSLDEDDTETPDMENDKEDE